MTRRAIAGASAVGAVTAATALVIGTMTGHAQTGTSSAYGVSAEGVVPIDPVPTVESTDGTEQTESEVDQELDGHGHVRVLKVSAGDNTASADLADVRLQESELEAFLQADAVRVSCEGDSGETTIVGLEGALGDQGGGESFQPDPNDEHEIPGVGKVTFNKQETDENGDFTVQGIVVELLEGTELEEKIVVSSATCGGPANGDDGDNGDDNGDDKPGNGDDGDNGDGDDDGDDDGADDGDDGKPTAPQPTPTETELPVTG